MTSGIRLGHESDLNLPLSTILIDQLTYNIYANLYLGTSSLMIVISYSLLLTIVMPTISLWLNPLLSPLGEKSILSMGSNPIPGVTSSSLVFSLVMEA